MFIDHKKEAMHFFQISASEQHTATDLVNLLYLILRPVSPDHTDFVKEFEQDGQNELISYLICRVQSTFQLGCKRRENTHRKLRARYD